MKSNRIARATILVTLLCFFVNLGAQTITTGNKTIDSAFSLAVKTIDNNTTKEGLILAGGDYGGEWTRDCAINSMNAMNFLRPRAAEYSLWSVTNNRQTIGHQYWDKIIWVIAAWDHYLFTNDKAFLRQAYTCARATIAELEKDCFNSRYGLFTGPAVFQDGIAGYDEPIYQRGNNSSYVLDHNARNIMCLSTNCIYYQAYACMNDMASELGHAVRPYKNKEKQLKNAIRNNFYNKSNNSLDYLIDQNGKHHTYTEGLGVAFAVLYDIVNKREAQKILSNVHITKYGVPCVYPSFPRNSAQKPGRHNVMIWPHVNMFYAAACAHVGVFDQFYFEVDNLARLAVDNGGFFEIYDPATGKPSGGWQSGHIWDECHNQTWCATGFLRQFLFEIFGIKVTPLGVKIRPIGMKDGRTCCIKGLKYHNCVLNITVTGRGQGEAPKLCTINGAKTSCFVGKNGEIYENGRLKRTRGELNINVTLNK